MHNIYYLGLSGERSLPFGLLVFYMLGGNLGSLLYGDVSVMQKKPLWCSGEATRLVNQG